MEEGHSGGDNYVSRDGRGAGVGRGMEGPSELRLSQEEGAWQKSVVRGSEKVEI